MWVGISVIAGLALLVLIVWMLHRNQQVRNAESVDRTLPLPPLELRDSEAVVSAEDILGLSPVPAPARNAPVAASKDPLSPAALTTDHWLDTSKQRLQEGQFASAYAAASSAFPQMRAFRQACRVQRAEIKSRKKQRTSAEPALQTLYRTAALADYFHGRTTAGGPLSPGALKKVTAADWKSLECPYDTLGVDRLSLLTKTDVRDLQQAWGIPNAHAHMRDLFPEKWQALCTRLGVKN